MILNLNHKVVSGPVDIKFLTSEGHYLFFSLPEMEQSEIWKWADKMTSEQFKSYFGKFGRAVKKPDGTLEFQVHGAPPTHFWGRIIVSI